MPRDYDWRIDPDEGRDEPELFYTHAWPCESCGKPCDERHRPYWAPELKVGICCALHSDEWLNDTEPTCDELFKLIATCISVAEVSAIMESHAHSGCLRCTPRKEAQSDSKPGQKRRAA